MCTYPQWPPFRNLIFFVLMDGPRKGLVASFATISLWIWQTIVQAYAIKGQEAPFPFMVHFTRAISASWAFRHHASVSSLQGGDLVIHAHFFTKSYKADVLASMDASFHHNFAGCCLRFFSKDLLGLFGVLACLPGCFLGSLPTPLYGTAFGRSLFGQN